MAVVAKAVHIMGNLGFYNKKIHYRIYVQIRQNSYAFYWQENYSVSFLFIYSKEEIFL